MRVAVDTNVPVVANGIDTHASLECQLAAVRRLRAIYQNQIVLMDGLGLIFDEYKRYLNFSGQPHAGDAFFKYVHENIANENLVERVEITLADGHPWKLISELPDDERLRHFDRNDQKFIAVALNAGAPPIQILNAVDILDWESIRDFLNDHNIELIHICD